MITITQVQDYGSYCRAKFTKTIDMTALDWASLFKFLKLDYSSIEVFQTLPYGTLPYGTLPYGTLPYEGVFVGPREIYSVLKSLEGVSLMPPQIWPFPPKAFETEEEWVNRKFKEEF